MEIDRIFLERLSKAGSVVFFTGAGMSSESGIPTFRGKNGIWNKLKPEELANFDAFLKNPELVWEWYSHRKKIIHESKPNAGHITIAAMQDIFSDVVVVTQNIDNLHKRAGSRQVFELHGNIEKNYCIKCKARYDHELENKVPVCKCGGLIRPDVVWFGEFLPEDQFYSSEKAARNADIFFIVGTSAVVYPAASLIYSAKQSGAYLVEINLEKTEASFLSDISFFGYSGKILPEIFNTLKEFTRKKI